jgi:RepB DNA-primase from phage plasmid
MMHSKSAGGMAHEPMPGEQPLCPALSANEDTEHEATLVRTPPNGLTQHTAYTAPDLEETRRFLRALDAGGIFTFQAIPEAKDSTARPTVLHGTLDEHASELEALNRSGAGIFVMVNAGDGQIKPGAKTCRTQANVIRVRALFADLDGAPVGPVVTADAPPDLIVETSPGRWHVYWIVDDVELNEFAHLQKSLAARFGGDPSVCDLPRVMRLPGFWHVKSDTPFLSRLVQLERLVLEEPCGT